MKTKVPVTRILKRIHEIQTTNNTKQKKGTSMKPSYATLIGLVCLLCLIIPANVIAAGTPAGTVITNFATMNYKDLAGNTYPAFNSNTISITVKQVAGVAFSPTTSSHASGDSSYQSYSIIVTNTGNGTDTYDLVKGSTQSWSPQLYLDANRNGVLDASEISAGMISATPSLAADSAAYIIARIYVPDGTASNTSDVLTVTATSQFKNTVTVSGTYTTTVSTAVINLSKTFSNMNPQPGQTVTLTINYSNTGTSTGTSAVVTNPVDPRLTFVSNSLTFPNGTTATYNSSTHTVTWTIGRLAGGQSGTMTFQLTIPSGILAGTTIGTQATIAYTDSANSVSRSVTSAARLMTVAQLAGGTAAITPSSQSIDVGLKVQYRITLTNTGNAEDSVRITNVSQRGLTWTYWVDANNDGIYGNDGDYLLNPNSSGPIAANGGVMHLIVVSTIPALTADHSIDSTRYIFTSYSNPASQGTVTGITTVKAPNMSLVKSYTVVGGGDPIPGATVEFSLAYNNSGTGAAASIVVSDNVPNDMTYTTGSIKLNGNAQTDGDDADGSQFTNGIVIVDLGTVGASASGTILFRASIK